MGEALARIYCPACARKLTVEYGDERQPLLSRPSQDIILLACPDCDAESTIVVNPKYLQEK